MRQPRQRATDLRDGQAAFALMQEVLGGQRRQQNVHQRVRLGHVSLHQQGAYVRGLETVGPRAVAGATDLGAEREIHVLVEKVDHGGIERRKPFGRCGSRLICESL